MNILLRPSLCTYWQLTGYCACPFGDGPLPLCMWVGEGPILSAALARHSNDSCIQSSGVLPKLKFQPSYLQRLGGNYIHKTGHNVGTPGRWLGWVNSFTVNLIFHLLFIANFEAWNYTCMLPVAFMAWCLVKHKNKFAFYGWSLLTV